MRNYGLWIDNQEIVDPALSKETLDPATNKPWAFATQATSKEVELAVVSAKKAFQGPWGSLSPADRSGLLRNFAALLRADAERIGRLETSDTGKLLAGTPAEMRRAADYLDYYVGIARAFVGSWVELSQTRHGAILNRPRGVVAAITPFNAPVTLTMWKLAPALATGNTIVIKPSPETPATPGELGRIAAKAGIPPGVVNVIYGDAEVGETLIRHPEVACVAFTGSSSVGSRIAATAAASFKHAIIEGGGKSAFIVFDDANLDVAIGQALNGIFGNSGQSCVASSRILVQRSIYDEFVGKMIARTEQILVGCPTEPRT